MSWRPEQLTRQQMEQRRRRAAQLLRQGRLSKTTIARQLGVSRVAVHQWQRQLQVQGLNGLRARHSTGRPARLSAAQWQHLLDLLPQGAQAAGFETGRWTLARIQTLVQQRFGVQLSRMQLSRKLRAAGWSCQRPVARARERDEALVEAWLKQDWPRIKKLAAQRRHDCVCG